MFRVQNGKTGKIYRLAVAGLLLLSGTALAVTVWVMMDFLREQEIVEELIRRLPSDVTDSAKMLAGELRWQFRLTILVVLNVVVTGIAIALLWRAYRSSQESLRDIKALAGDILSSMDQAVLTTDLNGNVTSINRRGLEILAPTEECVGRPLAELSKAVPLEQFRKEWFAEKSATMTRDFKILAARGERILRAFCQTLSNIDEAEIGFVLQLRDVTGRFLIEERMRRMERYMGLGSLAAGLHHEIKNPLTALSLHVQLLEEQLEQEDASAEVRQLLGVIKTEVTRVGGVLEGFRDFASIGILNLAPVNLGNLLQRQIDLISPQASSQSVEIELRLSNDLPKEIPGDRVRLEQVLLNVLLNALEALPTGGRITITAVSQSEAVTIEVSDTGSGIPDDLRDKIFDPYFTTKSEGTGLGLALCDKIIRQHDGSLDLRSSSQGTTFQLTLPVAPKKSSGAFE